MKYLIPLAFGLIFILFSCKQPAWSEDALPLMAADHTWQLSSMNWFEPNILQMSVGENELRFLSRYTLSRLDARGKMVVSTIRSGHNMDFFSRAVFSNHFYLFVSKSQNIGHLLYMESIIWHLRINDTLYYEQNGFTPNAGFSYSASLNGNEPAAVNLWGEFLINTIKSDHPDNVTLLLLNPYKLFVFGGTFPQARQWEVTLPAQAGTQVKRLIGLGDDFLVSTQEATFLVKRDGSFTQLWSAGATHAFTFLGKWYADVDSELYESADNGASWQVVGAGAGRLGTGEYYAIDSTLVYARKDSLYQVDHQSGHLSPINNEGLDGNQITSMAAFSDKIYVGTLTGLYIKPRHALLR